MGCYSTNSLQFMTNPSYLDLLHINPNNCIKSCQVGGYGLASLRENFCFCSNRPLIETMVNVSFCQTNDQICIGDTSNFCGSRMYQPVYSVSPYNGRIDVKLIILYTEEDLYINSKFMF